MRICPCVFVCIKCASVNVQLVAAAIVLSCELGRQGGHMSVSMEGVNPPEGTPLAKSLGGGPYSKTTGMGDEIHELCLTNEDTCVCHRKVNWFNILLEDGDLCLQHELLRNLFGFNTDHGTRRQAIEVSHRVYMEMYLAWQQQPSQAVKLFAETAVGRTLD